MLKCDTKVLARQGGQAGIYSNVPNFHQDSSELPTDVPAYVFHQDQVLSIAD